MTPVYYDYYELGVPWEGEYEEILNTDKEVYGGYDSWNGQKLTSYANPINGQPHRLGLKIPGFTGIYLKYKVPAKTKAETKTKRVTKKTSIKDRRITSKKEK